MLRSAKDSLNAHRMCWNASAVTESYRSGSSSSISYSLVTEVPNRRIGLMLRDPIPAMPPQARDHQDRECTMAAANAHGDLKPAPLWANMVARITRRLPRGKSRFIEWLCRGSNQRFVGKMV